MEKLNKEMFAGKLRFFGRCYDDTVRNAMYFNWTLSGFEVAFEGRTLDACFEVIAEIPNMPGPINNDPQPECPCIGIFADGSVEPHARIELKADGMYRLFTGDAGRHTIRVVKLSEEFRGQNGLLSIETDGCFLDAPVAPDKLKIEFIGDSITCGYGNESTVEMSPFRTAEENGWLTYGAIAARQLDADAKFICISGIAVSGGKYPWQTFMKLPTMEDIYEYTDKPYEEKRGITPHKEWDFESDPSDIVVLNLGTNDHNPMRFSRDFDKNLEEEEYFAEHYRKFIELIRRKNRKALICCCLGPMDHYLFDRIKDTVREYAADTGDQNIVSFRFNSLERFLEGIGGAGHPSLKTHARMADELVWLLHREYDSRKADGKL